MLRSTRILTIFCVLICSLVAFASRENKEVLKSVLSKAGPGKVVGFDLDDTLVNVVPRSIGIMREFANLPETRQAYPALAAKVLSQLQINQVGYSLPSVQLSAIGIKKDNDTSTNFLNTLDKYWLAHLGMNESYQYDVANPGAVEYVKAIHATGATVVYLTGRIQTESEQGTIDSLKRLGFPLDERAVPILRDNGTYTSDADFKVKALPKVRQYGDLIAFFDNEPENDLQLSAALPDADIVFLNTNWEGTDMNKLVAQPCILWLNDFVIPRP